jgi:hypothetical protein
MIAMKFVSLLSGAALLAACSPAPTWTDHVYKPQHFAAAFTAPPKVDPDPNPFLVEENDGSFDFGVTAACNIATAKSPDEMMSDAIEGTRQNGTVRSVTYTASGGVMGREMLVDRAGATTVKQRIFVKGNCMYLVFGSSKDGPDDAAVTHFLDSFRML